MFIKICGITSESDALLAVALGADAVGFVFAPSSRQIRPDDARDIARRLPPEILTVGVFRDSPPADVVATVGKAGLRAAQLHGRESPTVTRYVGERVPVVIKAFAAGDPAIAEAADHRPSAVMIDGAQPGSGQVFDWSLAEGAPDGYRLMLAGGLTADNVAAAIAAVRPWGVDVSSGVESEPGRKDPRRLRQFIEAARRASPDPEPVDLSELTEADLAADALRPYDWQVE